MLPLKGSRNKSAAKEFYILLDQPHKTYRAGEEVSGQMILILDKNVPDIRVELSLLGAIKLHGNGPLRSDAKEDLFNHHIVLYGDPANNELALTKGEHRFPFIVRLPKKNVHTSVSFGKGEIKYSLKGDILDGEESHVLSTEMLLNIIKPINLALLPEAQPKTLTFHNWKKGRASSSNSSINSSESWDVQQHGSGGTTEAPSNEIKIRLEIPSMGYLKGESIPVRLSIRHYKKITNVNGIFITLIRVCALDMGEDYEMQSFRKDLAQAIVPLIVEPSNTYEVSTMLKVPSDSFPTIVTNLVSFQYYIEVLLNMSNSSKVLPQQPKAELVDDEIIKYDANDRIYNVDKLKQMKNVLTLTSEIIIGTERKAISKPKRRHRHCAQEENQSSQQSLPRASQQQQLLLQQQLLQQQLQLQQHQQHQQQQPAAVPFSADDIPSPGILGGYPSIPSPPRPPTEKEILRLREEALMPSHPEAEEAPTSPLSGDGLDPPASPAPAYAEVMQEQQLMEPQHI